jgi:hypothetical protein
MGSMRRCAVLLAWAGCYHPSPHGGTCTRTSDCPAPLECVGGICGGTLDANTGDADLTCSCNGPATLHCAGGDTACPLGCVESAPARCGELVPSNGITTDRVGSVATAIAITADARFDGETGAISGAITRAGVTGVDAGIRFDLVGNYGVFTFAKLTIEAAATVEFNGDNAIVFLVGTTARIDGTIDISGGGGTQGQAGAGGGDGAIYGAAARGCGPGHPGVTELATASDGGGGGGGGGADGGKGGAAGTVALGGAAGVACIAADLQPLVGGSGGGGGAPGAVATALPSGGGGGGAIQISALDAITVNGTINVGGAGGDGGPPNNTGNAAAGGGGGAGGGILLEAISINYGSNAVLAANGGGAATNVIPGVVGENAHAAASAALGGATGMAPSTPGGNGGFAMIAAKPSLDASTNANGGGGGGAVGRIFVRTFAGTGPGASVVVSPPAGSAQIVYR